MLDAAYKDTLYYIRDEMNVTLGDAKSALEVAIEMQQDEHLKLLQSLMRSAAGAFDVIEFKASAKLAEEIVVTVAQLIAGQEKSRDDSLEAITTGVVLLPRFFAKTLDNNGIENAVALLPALKALRDARGGGDLSEQTMRVMALDLEGIAAQNLAEQAISFDRIKTTLDLRGQINQYRPVFQASLLGWIKGGDTEKHLVRLETLIEKFEQASQEERAFRLWWVTGAIIEALRDNGLKADANLRRLLGQVDRAGKYILDHGETNYQAQASNELLNELINVVQKIRSNGAKVSAVRKGFRLNAGLDENDLMEVAQSAMAAPDSQVMSSLSSAIKEDLEQVKDALDIFNRTGSKDNLDLEKRFSSLRKIADTLGMLGLNDLQDRLKLQEENLEELVGSDQKVTDDHLIPIAASLLQVESRLEEELAKMAGKTDSEEVPGYLKEALVANFVEIKVNLARVKECIAEFMSNPMDVKSVSRAPALLHEAQAAALMAEKDRLADVFGRLQQYTSRQLIGSGRLPYPEHLELLAGAIESADFYLETLSKGRRDPWYMLDNAETCLNKLIVSAPEPLESPRSGETSELNQLNTDIDIDSESTAVLDQTESPKPIRVLDKAKGATVLTRTLGNKGLVTSSDEYPVMDRSLDTDPEVIELFIEECREVNELMSAEYSKWNNDHSNLDALVTVRRSFHTFKGSGRMVGALRLGEFAWQAENLINQLLNNTIKIDDVGNDLLNRAVAVIPSLIEQFESGTDTTVDVHALMQNLENYTQGKLRPEDDESLHGLPIDVDKPYAKFQDTLHFDSVDELLKESDKLSSGSASHDLDDTATKVFNGELTAEFKVVDATQAMSTLDAADLGIDIDGEDSGAPMQTQIIDMRGLIDDEESLEEKPKTRIIDMRDQVTNLGDADDLIDGDVDGDDIPLSVDEIQIQDTASSIQLDATLNNILQVESEGHLSVIRDFAMNSVGEMVSADLHRAVHTLHGSVHMAEILPMVSLASAFENLVQKLYDQGIPIEQNIADIMLRCVGQLDAMVKTVNTQKPMPQPDNQLIAELQQLRSSVVTQIFDPEFVRQALGEDSKPSDHEGLFIDDNAINDTGQNQTVNLDKLSHEQLTADETSVKSQVGAALSLDVDEDILEIFIEEAKDIVVATDGNVANWQDEKMPESDMRDIQRHLHTIKGGARMAGLMEFGDFTHDLESYVLAIQTGMVEHSPDTRRILQKAVDHIHQMLEDVQARKVPQVGEDILALMQAAQNTSSLSEMDEQPENHQSDDLLVENISEVIAAIDTESELAPDLALVDTIDVSSVDVSADISTDVSADVLGAPDSNLDALSVISTAESVGQIGASDDTHADIDSVLAELNSELESLSESVQQDELNQQQEANNAVAVDAVVPDSTDTTDVDAKNIDVDQIDIFDYKIAEVTAQQSKSRQQDAARISTNNLETLLNQAGEVSIYRSRIEQEISNASLNLNELARTVQRVRDQLRSMEIETEAQILHQYKDEITDADFDPLEMDRYSNIQQLSRALAESVNDLQSLDALLGNQLRDTEALLLQQSRVVTDLQDNLMRVRMIPFARYAPRYARIVRQISNEVGKEVELNVVGAESEIDRQVIERMQGPLEHMIRNAVIHGIETPDDRKKVGKDIEGVVNLALSREGVNLLMTLEDDGSGLDFQRIRKKALDLKLIDANQVFTDNDLAQLILVSGFSTAGQVTQNAGRGVGMDVVANEIKQLGGSLQISSVPGKGTKFTMRLPFTRAINHALLVEAAEESYAIPLHKIDGIATIALPALQKLLETEQPVFHYGNQDYDVKALSELVGLPRTQFESDDNSVSLVLVSAGNRRAALAVHQLHGNREMVIKPVGPQIAGIRGISGATILGDGRIIVILDIDTLMAAQIHEVALTETIQEPEALPLIMVVDDSITVRRVTERLLERNQMQVITARDGLDALTQLQELNVIPDVILMDIEMPRMDGYELAERVRADSETKATPIIMITSRTGNKHRARAMEIGVNDYLGKPYREDQLLDAIQPFLKQDEVA